MLYRRLTKEELEELTEDFAIFLASNSIDKKEWDEIKQKEIEKAEELIDIFSDLVFEKALKSAKHLERISEFEIHCYAFFAKQAHMISARILEDQGLNFIDSDMPSVLSKSLKHNNLELLQGTKKFRKGRSEEMVAVLKTGAVISKDAELYQLILGLL